MRTGKVFCGTCRGGFASLAKVITHQSREPDGPPGIEPIGDLASKAGTETTRALLAGFADPLKGTPSSWLAPREPHASGVTDGRQPPFGGSARPRAGRYPPAQLRRKAQPPSLSGRKASSIGTVPTSFI